MSSAVSSYVKYTMDSRAVIAAVTVRFSRATTFSITARSEGAMTPAAAPALTVARMSSPVTLSVLSVASPNMRMIPDETISSTKTSGRKMMISTRMGRAQNMAMRSGLLSETRLGMRSEKITKASVTVMNEQKKPSRPA